MSKNQSQFQSDKRADKRAVVLGPEKKSRAPLIFCLVLLIAAPVGAYLILNTADSGSISAPVADTAAQPVKVAAAGGGIPASPDVVAYPVTMFEDGKARHFELAHGDIIVRYFILKSADGVIRAAFDACDVCWPAGKGYFQEGDVMVCRNCGRRFDSIRINEVKGGCNPAPLKRAVDGDRVVIRVTDIIEGRPYFNFKGKA
jgi:uncharacterized membrane protein